MGHQCHQWAKKPSTFVLLILILCTPSLYVTNYQKLIFYLASIFRKDTCYLIAGTLKDSYSSTEKAHTWPTPETVNNITTLHSSNLPLRIPSRHYGTIPINIKRHDLRDHMTYFINNQHTKKGPDPNIHVIDGIYDIEGKLTLHILVANHTNKHVTCNNFQTPLHNLSQELNSHSINYWKHSNPDLYDMRQVLVPHT